MGSGGTTAGLVAGRLLCAARWRVVGVPVDNDIGLFFGSYATRDWDRMDPTPRVVAVTVLRPRRWGSGRARSERLGGSRG